MLCIGGPYAGRLYAAEEDRSWFRVAIRPPMSISVSPLMEAEPVKYDVFVYRKETFHSPQGELSCWVPDGQTPLETMRLLFETYERSCKGDKT